MNYQILKNIIESLIQNFRCPGCNLGISDGNIEIISAAGTHINLDAGCPHCGKHTFVKAEFSQVNLGNMDQLSAENLEELKKQLYNKVSNSFLVKGDTHKIQEKEILEMRKKLKSEHLNVADFFEQN